MSKKKATPPAPPLATKPEMEHSNYNSFKTVEASDPNETIKIVEQPPEVVGVAAAFHTPTLDELKDFPPPPPLTAPIAAVAAPPAMDDKTTHGKAMMGTRTEPPKVVETRPAPPPAGTAFDDLPEKTKAEMRAGQQAIGHRGDDASLSRAIDQQAPNKERPGATSHGRNERPAGSDIDESKLSERTRLELKAGRDLLARKNADYKAVLDKVAGNAAKRLDEGAPAAPSDLDYPRG
jgi:hypothetical protein